MSAPLGSSCAKSLLLDKRRDQRVRRSHASVKDHDGGCSISRPVGAAEQALDRFSRFTAAKIDVECG
jgi:hypothetical protein